MVTLDHVHDDVIRRLNHLKFNKIKIIPVFQICHFLLTHTQINLKLKLDRELSYFLTLFVCVYLIVHKRELETER